MSVPALHADGVSKWFDGRRVLDAVDIEVREGEFFSLLGPSGCGKTTALRIVAGLDAPDEGRVSINGTDVTRTPAHRRPTNLVFQQGALFPHLSVFDNVAFGLRTEKTAKREIAGRVEELLDVVGMAEFAGRAPGTLSGGQRQRVAMARALVRRPQVLLLDEPLSALDLGLQLRMRRELRALQRRTGTAFVCVTHNQAEAMEISDRIAVLNAGRVEQTGTARELYHTPASRFVAEFIGENNLFAGATADGLTLPADHDGLLAVRPESFRLAAADDAASVGTATVRSAGFLGPRLRVVLETATGREVLVDAEAGATTAAVGERVGLAVAAAQVAVVPETAVPEAAVPEAGLPEEGAVREAAS
ncbi:ABC transporter ATP-binding protein [Streptomyces hainanensis]|uniref:ABC-type quaternary amine transporter n=1 Tax=Streptomyces hainanensis TaxID=402648 RepID=A0A4R4TH72_9ACTN|nr:ABC transporter ATP-binding protein [Streptomyces hainanensis]TDC74572.1 ABC transporter ATP-binding protein [Streptomyces hainanensis]